MGDSETIEGRRQCNRQTPASDSNFHAGLSVPVTQPAEIKATRPDAGVLAVGDEGAPCRPVGGGGRGAHRYGRRARSVTPLARRLPRGSSSRATQSGRHGQERICSPPQRPEPSGARCWSESVRWTLFNAWITTLGRRPA
jgi:hypothetical protein